MQSILAFLATWRGRRLNNFLQSHGRSITVQVRGTLTIDDAPHHPPDDKRYIHYITANWTDPANGKAYEFHQQFRSWREVHFRMGDLVSVLIDPRDGRRYQVQV